MSDKRNLRQRQLVPDTNYPGKRVKRAITISCERQNSFEELETSARKAKTIPTRSRSRNQNSGTNGVYFVLNHRILLIVQKIT